MRDDGEVPKRFTSTEPVWREDPIQSATNPADRLISGFRAQSSRAMVEGMRENA